MKRASKNLVILVLGFSFISAGLCATLAAPGQSLASVSGCSQDAIPTEMTDCEHPRYLCGFDPSSTLLSQSALSSARSNDSLKNSFGVAIGAACFDSSAYSGPFVGNEHRTARSVGRQKISIHLYNSVLTL
jgi:hypothetical protein